MWGGELVCVCVCVCVCVSVCVCVCVCAVGPMVDGAAPSVYCHSSLAFLLPAFALNTSGEMLQHVPYTFLFSATEAWTDGQVEKSKNYL